MNKKRKIIVFILILTIAFSVLVPAPVFAEPDVISRGFSELLMGVCNIAVNFYNENGISIQRMITQGNTDIKGYEEPPSNAVYDLTTVTIDDEGKIDGLFSDVTSKFYPKLVLLAIVVFLIGFIYIGLLTLLSTAASKRQDYQQRLITWGTGLLMLFVFGYVMIYVIKVNNALAATFMNIGSAYVAESSSGSGDDSTGEKTPITNPTDKQKNDMGYIDGSGKKITALDLINDFRERGKNNQTISNNCTGADKITAEVKVKEDNITFEVWEGSNKDKIFTVKPLSWGGTVRDGQAEEKTLDGEYSKDYTAKDKIPKGDVYGNHAYKVTVKFDNGEYRDYSLTVYLKTTERVIRTNTKGGFYIYEDVESEKLSGSDIFGSVVDGQFTANTFDSALAYGSGNLRLYADYESIYNSVNAAGETVVPDDMYLKELYDLYMEPENVGYFGYALLYAMGVFQTFMLLIVYVSRTFMISFLIIFFPVVMAIYCLDKLNDNKSSAFSSWLKEFLSHVFTNAVHALCYAIAFAIVLNPDLESPAIVKVIAVWFILPSAEMLKQIFNVQPKTGGHDHGALVALGAIGSSAIGQGNKMIGGSKSGGGGGSGGGGSGGGIGGIGGSGGGGGSFSLARGGRKVGSRLGQGLLKAGGAAATLAVVGTAASLGAASRMAQGQDLKEIVEGGASGAALGYGGVQLGRAGARKLGTGAKAVGGYMSSGGPQKTFTAVGGAFSNRNEKKRMDRAIKSGNGPSPGGRQVKVATTADERTFSVQKRMDTNDRTAISAYESRTGNRVDMATGLVTNANGAVMEDFKFKGDYSAELGGASSMVASVAFDSSGHIDESSWKIDNSVIESNVSEMMRHREDNYNGRAQHFINNPNYGINQADMGTLGTDVGYTAALNKLNQHYDNFTGPLTTAQIQEKNADYASLASLHSEKKQMVLQANEHRDNLLNNAKNSTRNMVNSELRNFYKTRNANNIP